ncbi:FG-GAP repeat domain-containing protein [Streptomyces sp. NPDC001076]
MISGRFRTGSGEYADGNLVYLGADSRPKALRMPVDGGKQGAVLGDVNGDGYDDIVTSDVLVRGDKAGAGEAGRALRVGAGLVETDDFWGSAVHLADLDGDHRADLAVGTRHENGGRGAVWTLPGSAVGPTTTGAAFFHATSVGVSGTSAQLGSLFGQ